MSIKRSYDTITKNLSKDRLSNLTPSLSQSLTYQHLWNIFKAHSFSNKTHSVMAITLQEIMKVLRSQQLPKDASSVAPDDQRIIFAHDFDNLLAVLIDGKSITEPDTIVSDNKTIESDEQNESDKKSKERLAARITSMKVLTIAFIVTVVIAIIFLWAAWHSQSIDVLKGQVGEMITQYRTLVESSIVDSLVRPIYIGSATQAIFNNINWDNITRIVNNNSTELDIFFLNELGTYQLNTLFIVLTNGNMLGATYFEGSPVIITRNNTHPNNCTHYHLVDELTQQRISLLYTNCVFDPIIELSDSFIYSNNWMQHNCFNRDDLTDGCFTNILTEDNLDNTTSPVAIIGADVSFEYLTGLLISEPSPFPNSVTYVMDKSLQYILFTSDEEINYPLSHFSSDSKIRISAEWYNSQDREVFSYFLDSDVDPLMISANTLHDTLAGLEWDILTVVSFDDYASHVYIADYSSIVVTVLLISIIIGLIYYVHKKSQELTEEAEIEEEIAAKPSDSVPTIDNIEESESSHIKQLDSTEIELIETSKGRVGHPRQLTRALDSDGNIKLNAISTLSLKSHQSTSSLDKLSKEQLKDEYQVLRSNIQRFSVQIYLWIIIIIILFLALFGIWQLSANDFIDHTKYDTVLETSRNIFKITKDIFRNADLVLSVVSNHISFSSVLNSELATTSNSIDDLLYGLMSSFVIAPSDELIVDSIYFIIPDQNNTVEMITRNFNDDQVYDNSFFYAARNADNNYCFTHYDVNEDHHRSSPVFVSPGCSFDMTRLQWYTNIIDSQSKQWSEIYELRSGSLGITLAVPLYDKFNNLQVVCAVDLALSTLNYKIRTKLAQNRDVITYDITSSGYLLLSSKGQTYKTVQNHALSLLASEKSTTNPDNDYISTASLLISGLYHDDLSSFASITSIRRGFFDPFTTVYWLNDPDVNLNLLSVVLLFPEKYQSPVTSLENTQLLLGAGLFLLTMVFLGRSIVGLLGLEPSTPYADDLGNDLDEKHLRKKLFRYAKLIGPLVTNAYKGCIYRNKSILSIKEENSTARPAAAYSHIQSMIQQRNILIVCALTNVANPNPLFWYKIYHNIKYRYPVNVIIFFHIILAFFEPPTTKALVASGLHWSLIVLESFCLAVEIFDLTIKMLIYYYWLPKSSTSLPAPVSRCFRINHSLNALHLVILCFIIIDFVVTISMHRSFEYFFPLRPFLLIITNGQVQTALHVFLVSIFKARYAFLMFFCLLIILSVFGSILFSSFVFARVEASFIDFLRAVTTTFVLITTGENYTDLVYPAAATRNYSYVIFFIISILIGMFIILPIVLALFQSTFKKIRLQATNMYISQARSAIVAAFITLDRDRGGQLDLSEFKAFIDYLKRRQSKPKDERTFWMQFYEVKDEMPQPPHSTPQIDLPVVHEDSPNFPDQYHRDIETKTGRRVPLVRQSSDFGINRYIDPDGKAWADDYSRMQDFSAWEQTKKKTSATTLAPRFKVPLELYDFVAAIEEYSILLHFRTSDPSLVRKILCLSRAVVESYWWYTLSLVLVMLNIWILCFYGTYSNEVVLDSLCFIIILFHSVMLFFVIYIYGWDEYWNYKKYTADIHSITEMHRVDCVTVTLSLFLFILFCFIGGEFGFSNHPYLRICLIIPCLRIFFLISPIRHLVSTLIHILPRFASLIFLLLVLMFMFGLIGVNLFAGKFTTVAILSQEEFFGNFDSLGNAMLTLFQLLVGESWYDIMYAAISISSWRVSWYFIAFIAIITLLFTNLFLSIVLDAFQAMMELEKDVKSDEEQDDTEIDSQKDQERLKIRRRVLGVGVLSNF